VLNQLSQGQLYLLPLPKVNYFADSGGRSVGIVRLRTKATEFSLVLEYKVAGMWQMNCILGQAISILAGGTDKPD
jgi:hypothetical protein